MILEETSRKEDHSSLLTTSSLLLLLTPILRIAFSRVLLDTTQPTQSHPHHQSSSKTGVEVMANYWKGHFDNDESLEIPAELVDSLSILRKIEGISVPNLLESQVEESIEQLPVVPARDGGGGAGMETVVEREEGNDSLEAPPPGQRASSPVLEQNEDSFVAHSRGFSFDHLLSRTDGSYCCPQILTHRWIDPKDAVGIMPIFRSRKLLFPPPPSDERFRRRDRSYDSQVLRWECLFSNFENWRNRGRGKLLGCWRDRRGSLVSRLAF